MGVTYFKRYRMEVNLRRPLFRPMRLPAGYEVRPWRPALWEAHAAAKFRSFRFEIDANVFPCLGTQEGCSRLIRDISRRDGFLSGATWLLEYREPGLPGEACGTIQGVRDDDFGAVQNLGVAPEHRGQGLGTRLLYQALVGFREAGLERAYLEVTAQNQGAVRLYHQLGFRTVKTVYKAAEVAFV